MADTTTTTTVATVATTVTDPTGEVRPSWIWIKDSTGYGSVTVTLLFISFWVTTVAYILSMVEHIGPVTFRPFDVTASGAYFGIVAGLYAARKLTDAKFPGGT